MNLFHVESKLNQTINTLGVMHVLCYGFRGHNRGKLSAPNRFFYTYTHKNEIEAHTLLVLKRRRIAPSIVCRWEQCSTTKQINPVKVLPEHSIVVSIPKCLCAEFNLSMKTVGLCASALHSCSKPLSSFNVIELHWAVMVANISPIWTFSAIYRHQQSTSLTHRLVSLARVHF